jgi:hypothetical protein
MKLHDSEPFAIALVGDAHARRDSAFTASALRITTFRLANDHVAEIPAAPCDMPPGGGAVLDRGDDFEKVAVDGNERVLQTPHTDTRIDVAGFNSKDRGQIVYRGRKFRCDQRNLAQMKAHVAWLRLSRSIVLGSVILGPSATMRYGNTEQVSSSRKRGTRFP